MRFGYARVSTQSQDLNDQIEKLQQKNCDKIFSEKYTGTTTKRPEFSKLIKQLRQDDELVITKLDRLARNTKEALEIIEDLQSKKVVIDVLNLGRIDNTAIGKFTTTLLLAVADMERDMIIERTQSGKEFAKKHKKDYREGRPRRKIDKNRLAMYDYLQNHSYNETAEAFNVSRTTVYYVKKQIEDSESETN